MPTVRFVPLDAWYSSDAMPRLLRWSQRDCRSALCAFHAAMGSSSTRQVCRMASQSFSTARAFVSCGNTFFAHAAPGTAAMHHW